MFHEKNVKIGVYILATLLLFVMIHLSYQQIGVLYAYHAITFEISVLYGFIALIILLSFVVMLIGYKPTMKKYRLIFSFIVLIVTLQWGFVLMSDSSFFYISLAGSTFYLLYYFYIIFIKKLSHPVSNFRFMATSFAMPAAFIINIEFQGNVFNNYLLPLEFLGYMALFFSYPTIIGASVNLFLLPPQMPHEKKALYDEILYNRQLKKE